MKDRTIYSSNTINYGKVICCLKEVLDKKGISKTQLAKRTGLQHTIINRYVSGNAIRYDSDVLAKLCYVLDCKLSDIIKYVDS